MEGKTMYKIYGEAGHIVGFIMDSTDKGYNILDVLKYHEYDIVHVEDAMIDVFKTEEFNRIIDNVGCT